MEYQSQPIRLWLWKFGSVRISISISDLFISYSDVTLTPPNYRGCWILNHLQLAFLSSLSCLQVIQKSAPGVRQRHIWQLDVLGTSSGDMLSWRKFEFLWTNVCFLFLNWENKSLIGPTKKRWPIKLFFAQFSTGIKELKVNHNKYSKFCQISKSPERYQEH